MNIKTDILLRVYLAFGLIVLFALAILYQLFNVQVIEGDKWRAMADSLSTRFVNVEAARGNIYSVDGSLLATSVPEYELRMDMLAGGVQKDEVFYEKVDSLGSKLSAFFGDKSAKQYSRMLRNARRDNERYVLLRRNVSHQDLKVIRKFPIFSMGRNQGGLIVVQQNKRILPFRALAARTIGYKNANVQPVGLEGAYSDYIDGESGKRLMQRIAGGVWMPVNQDIEIAPKDGADIISTIDINMQDVAQRALEKQLIKSKAEFGCVVLMEVATGEIRAVANLSKVTEGNYREKFNYAIAQSAEPGSTFKLASYLALLEDGKVDTGTLVDAEGGTYKVYNNRNKLVKTVKDSHLGLQVISVKKAFEESSNAAIAKLVYTHYLNDADQFTNHLHNNLHLNTRADLQIPGEGRPMIKTPQSKFWYKGLSLAQMAYGYEMQMTPLQMLTFYNAVANDGKMVAPMFVREIRRFGNTVENFEARVIDEKIASAETIGKLQGMLEGVVEEGTGKTVIKNPLYKIAGKTGTAQIADGKLGYKSKRSYQASFVGYFPADNPKYSMIVIISNPVGEYYAASTAGPVFREVADMVYANDVQMYNPVKEIKLAQNGEMPQAKAGQKKAAKSVYNAFGIHTVFASAGEYINSVDSSSGVKTREISTNEGFVPDVLGMGLKDALYLIGNSGLKSSVKGRGRVTKQSLAGGMRVGKGSSIFLELE